MTKGQAQQLLRRLHVAAPVENRTYGFPAHGSTPLIVLHGMTMKRRCPFLQFHRCSPVYSLRVHWGPLFPSSQRLGAFALGPPPRVDGFPVLRLLRPIRHSSQASGFRPGSPPSSCPLPFASGEELPVFSLEDSNGTRQVACSSPCPCRSLRLPSLWTQETLSETMI